MSILDTKKKLISIILSICFCISIFPTLIYAEATDEDYPSFELLSFLGIDEGVNKDNSALITRAEFTAMAVRSINPKNLSLYDGSFGDVAENDLFSKEIYIAKSLRMTSGTSDGIFSPASHIDMAAAQKMLVTAMGFENYAVALGGYPTGYNVVASRIGILKGISSGGTLTVGNAKLMISNALKSDKAVITGIVDGDVHLSSTKGVNLLTDNFGLTLVSDVVSKASYLSTSAKFDNDDTLKIGSLELKAEFDTSKYFGKSVNAWYDDDKILRTIEEDTNSEVIISADEVSSYLDYKLTVYNENDREESYTMESNFIFVENGRPIIHNNESFLFENGSLRLIDNDGNGKYDLVVAEKLKYFVVESKSDNVMSIYDNDSEIKSISFDEDDDLCRVIKDASGNILSYNDIPLGSVLEIAVSSDGKICVATISGANTLTGIVDEMQSISFTYNSSTYQAPDKLIINDTVYETTDYFKINNKKVYLGKKNDFLLSNDGKIVAMANSAESDMSYGYFLGYGQNQGLDADVQIKLLSEKNNIEIYSLADKITFDGKSRVSSSDASVKNKLMSGSSPIYQLIKYKLNGDGKLSVLDTKTDLSTSFASNYDIPEFIDTNDTLSKYDKAEEVDYVANGGQMGPNYYLDRSIIFVVPTGCETSIGTTYEDKNFTVLPMSELVNITKDYTCDFYDFDSFYYPKATVIFDNVTGGGKVPELSASNFVYKITDAVTSDGEITKAVHSVSKGYYSKRLINPERLAESPAILPSVGAVARFLLNSEGEITNTIIDAELNGETVNLPNGGGSKWRADIAYAKGKVKLAGENILAMVLDQAPGFTGTIFSAMKMRSGCTVTIYNMTTGEVTVGSINDIKSENNFGSDADQVVARCWNLMADAIFVYTK